MPREVQGWARRLVIESHVIPFENRWTNGEHASEWHCELERPGVPTVRTMYCEHETHYRGETAVVCDIPAGFVHARLAVHCRRAARQQSIVLCSGITLS